MQITHPSTIYPDQHKCESLLQSSICKSCLCPWKGVSGIRITKLGNSELLGNPKAGYIFPHPISCSNFSPFHSPSRMSQEYPDDPPTSPLSRALEEPNYFILQNMMDTDVSNIPPLNSMPPPSLLLDRMGIEAVESPLALNHLPIVLSPLTITSNSLPVISTPLPIQMPTIPPSKNILTDLLQ